MTHITSDENTISNESITPLEVKAAIQGFKKGKTIIQNQFDFLFPA